MRCCIESLLPGGEDVEILIVNDGSTDKTADIANEYAAKYPTIVKAIHQENGGHGEAVNAGIRHASGLYFKVVDSDDWVDVPAYFEILKVLNQFVAEAKSIDMLISNFVYEKEGLKRKKVMNYDHALPEGRIFTWDDMKRFRKGRYLMMHSLIFRTQLLQDSGLTLPKHTFYVDNLYVFIPLQHVKKMYYANVDFYRYFIGRQDQSVQESTMIRRIDQQIKVNKLMVDQIEADNIAHPMLEHYLLRHLEIVTVISSILLIRSGAEENFKKKKELWKYIKAKDVRLYHRLKYGFLGRLISLPGRYGRLVSVGAYKISQRIYGFN